MSPASPELRRAAEAILFVAEEPVAASELALVLELPASEVEALMEELGSSYEEQGRGFVLRRVSGGYRLASHPAAAPFLERFVSEHRPARMTQAALETLAVVAYRQPVSRAQIAEIRGVSPDSVLRTSSSFAPALARLDDIDVAEEQEGAPTAGSRERCRQVGASVEVAPGVVSWIPFVLGQLP